MQFLSAVNLVAGAAVTVKRRFIRPILTLSFTSPLVLPTGPCATAEVIFGGRRLQCRRLHGLTYRGTVVISAHIHLTTQLEPLLLNLSKPTHRGLPDHFVLC